MGFSICVLGNLNTGKSSIFNRCVGKGGDNLVNNIPGLTRDFVYGEIKYKDCKWTIIDTPGISTDLTIDFSRINIEKIVKVANGADLILYVVDRIEFSKQNFIYASKLYNKTLTLVLSKNECKVPAEGWNLENVFYVSSFSYQGLDNVFQKIYDAYVKRINVEMLDDNKIKGINIALVGRPNVGKSSFLNCILGYDKQLVYHKPGTTIDSVMIDAQYKGKRLRFFDTAGIRKKRVAKDFEQEAIYDTFKVIHTSTVIMILIDANVPITEQDIKIVSHVKKLSKMMIVIVNKWDLVKKKIDKQNFLSLLYLKMGFLKGISCFFISAKTGEGIENVLENLLEVYNQYMTRVPTSSLNKLIQKMVTQNPIPLYKGRRVKIYYGSQVSVSPPTFFFMTNVRLGILASYRKYLEKKIQDNFFSMNCPVKINLFERSI
ncbi:MAG: ribosome biogenesis GTPase Der [Deltaproteobacteria bacterium]|nr:MAG: ribosome biogenesis GTPase Der [Deltaproteobacteria bacterium]